MEVGSSVSLASRFTPGRTPSAHRTRRPHEAMNEVHNISLILRIRNVLCAPTDGIIIVIKLKMKAILLQ